jgi:hypothetical protein
VTVLPPSISLVACLNHTLFFAPFWAYSLMSYSWVVPPPPIVAIAAPANERPNVPGKLARSGWAGGVKQSTFCMVHRKTMITMGSPDFVWINANEIISPWYLLGAGCVTPPGWAAPRGDSRCEPQVLLWNTCGYDSAGTLAAEVAVAAGESVIKYKSPLNVLKDTYDHSCCLARSYEYNHLMTDSPWAHSRWRSRGAPTRGRWR